MRQVPNAVVHSLWIVVDERDLFRGIELRKGADTYPQKKTQILVLFAVQISVEELRMRGIVQSSEQVSIDIIHALALQQILGKAQSFFVTLAHFLAPVVQHGGCFWRRWDLFAKSSCEFCGTVAGEAKNCVVEIFVGLGRSGAAGEFADIENGGRFQIEMSFTNKDRT